MPELPEVETIKESLQSIVGCTLRDIRVIRTDYVRLWERQPIDYIGSRMGSISRRGKFLIFSTDKNQHIVAHLGMSGRIYLQPRCAEMEKHVHLIIDLDNEQQLIFQDARRFGGVWFAQDPRSMFDSMGIEPLSRQFTARYLEPLLQNRRVAIKTLLLNQRFISGIGNIYADEALFQAGIRPDRPAGSLQTAEVRRLVKAVKQVLRAGIEQRGTTLRDFQDGHKQKGGFQDHLQVYGRQQQPCSSCRQPIMRIVINGRSSHFCPRCQK